MVFVWGFILFVMLCALGAEDLRSYRLPDLLTFPLIGLGLAFAYLSGASVWSHVIGAVIGYAVFVGLELAYRRFRGRDGLGRGDAKLLAAGGAWCGWFGLPFIVLVASGSALAAILLPSMRKKLESGAMPFGPFLALGIFLVWAALQRTGLAV